MSWDWDFGKYPENWEEISRGVKDRDNWTCQTCGRHRRQVNRLIAHHILSNRLSGDSSPSNLITVCDWCHSQIHNHVRAKSPPPENKMGALSKIKYLKNHPEITASEFKHKYKRLSKQTATPSNPILILMVASLILITWNISVWLIVEAILGVSLIYRHTSKPGISSLQTDTSSRNLNRVTVGSTVTLVDEETGDAKNYGIVDPEEIDLENNKISTESDVGKAISGHTTGDTVTVETSSGERQLLIRRVEK